MDFHGDINLNDNEMQKMVLEAETTFPASPTVGRVVFKGGVVYICAEFGSILMWVPLTNKINTYIHDQTTSSTSWSIVHNLNTTNPLVQVYDDDMTLIIPENVEVTDNNTVTVTLGTASVGRGIVMYGTIDFSGGVIEPDAVAYLHTQSSGSSTWVVRHRLGYYPIVRTFNDSGFEFLPENVVHDDIFQTTITFSSAQTGTARFV